MKKTILFVIGPSKPSKASQDAVLARRPGLVYEHNAITAGPMMSTE
jgi:hypothetical protein